MDQLRPDQLPLKPQPSAIFTDEQIAAAAASVSPEDLLKGDLEGVLREDAPTEEK